MGGRGRTTFKSYMEGVCINVGCANEGCLRERWEIMWVGRRKADGGRAHNLIIERSNSRRCVGLGGEECQRRATVSCETKSVGKAA
jgi:hypothetical protein